jgi:hypothetical protein
MEWWQIQELMITLIWRDSSGAWWTPPNSTGSSRRGRVRKRKAEGPEPLGAGQWITMTAVPLIVAGGSALSTTGPVS